MESFGKRLTNYRKAKNLTQNEIAEKLNVSPQAVSKWENDISSPGIDSLVILSELFDVSLDELLGKETPKTEFVEKQTKKDLNNLVFKIVVDSEEGDHVKLNLPLAVVKIFASSGTTSSFVNGNKALEGVDFKQLLELVEQGVVGEILTVNSANGDHVKIVVE